LKASFLVGGYEQLDLCRLTGFITLTEVRLFVNEIPVDVTRGLSVMSERWPILTLKIVRSCSIFSFVDFKSAVSEAGSLPPDISLFLYDVARVPVARAWLG
jgi:hypothetical protein